MIRSDSSLIEIVQEHGDAIDRHRKHLDSLNNGTSEYHRGLGQSNLAESTLNVILSSIEADKPISQRKIAERERMLLCDLRKRSLDAFPREEEFLSFDILELIAEDTSEDSISITPRKLFKATLYNWNADRSCELTGLANPGDLVLDVRLSTTQWKRLPQKEKGAIVREEFLNLVNMCSQLGSILPEGKHITVCFTAGQELYGLLSDVGGAVLKEMVDEGKALILESPEDYIEEYYKWNLIKERLLLALAKSKQIHLLPTKPGAKPFSQFDALAMKVMVVAMRF